MKFQVTTEDIVNGIANNTEFCPIAACIKRTLKISELTKESIEPYKSLKGNTRLVCTIMAFIIDFDEGRPVEPFEFELN